MRTEDQPAAYAAHTAEAPADALADLPIVESLIRHVQCARYGLHVPGHKQGRLLPRELLHWLGAAARIDLTELPGLDNLHQAEGCIAASQRLAAEWYGSDRCWYSVNGSTACVMAALWAVVPPGGRVLFLNPFHQSAWRALELANAEPVFARVTFDPVRMTCEAPTAERTREALRRNPDVSAVFLTSPTYPGVVAPVREIAEVVHEAGVPLIVDEAHGAHLGLTPALPPHSVAAGADLVIHSVHKMLPGLTQTAWLHAAGDRVDWDRVAHAMRWLQTTSPSYLLLASLDAAQAWLRREGAVTAERGLAVLEPLRELRDGNGDAWCWDPFKHWQPTGDAAASRRLADALAQRGLVVEYADALGVLSIFGLDTPPAIVESYVETVRAWRASTQPGHGILPVHRVLLEGLASARFMLRPREAAVRARCWVPVSDSCGRVSAGLITPYPPGVPVLFPGQVIEPWLQEALEELVRLNGFGGRSMSELHGVTGDGQIAVIAEGVSQDGLHHV